MLEISPVWSLRARGSIGNETTYQVRNGVQYKYLYTVPFDPHSPAQLAQRARYEDAYNLYQIANSGPSDPQAWQLAGEVAGAAGGGWQLANASIQQQLDLRNRAMLAYFPLPWESRSATFLQRHIYPGTDIDLSDLVLLIGTSPFKMSQVPAVFREESTYTRHELTVECAQWDSAPFGTYAQIITKKNLSQSLDNFLISAIYPHP